MDIDDEPILHDSIEDDHMMIDGTPAVVSMSSQPDDLMQTDDIAVTAAVTIPGVDMDEEMEEGDREDDGDELMVVTEEDEKLEEPSRSARMSPVDEPPLVIPSFSPFPTLQPSPIHSPALSQPLESNPETTPPTWPPAPTDVPAVPSQLPDALSVVESGIAAVHEEARQAEDGTAVVETASVRTEPARSVMEGNVVEGGGGGDELEEEHQEQLVDDSTEQIEAFYEPTTVQDMAADIQPQPEDQLPSTDEYDELIEQQHHDHDQVHVDVEEDLEESMEDVIPPILLIFSDVLSRSLFFPLPNDVDPPSSLVGDVVLEQKVEEIAHAPLEEFFAELRLALGEEWDETRGIDMVLEQRDVQLTIKENDKQTLQLSLMDIITLHMRLGCPQPLVFHVTSTAENFYRRYKTILGMLDAREVSEHGDEVEVEGEEEVVDEDVLEKGGQEMMTSTAELKQVEEEPEVAPPVSEEQHEPEVVESGQILSQVHAENLEGSPDIDQVTAPSDELHSQAETVIEASSSFAPALEQQPDTEASNNISEQDTERQDEEGEVIEGEEQYEFYQEGEEEHTEEDHDQAAEYEPGAEEEWYGADIHEEYLENEHVAEDEHGAEDDEDDEQGGEDDEEVLEEGEEDEEYEDHGDEYGVNGAIAAAETLVDVDSELAAPVIHADSVAVNGEPKQADVVAAANGHSSDDAEVMTTDPSPKKRSLEDEEEEDDSRNVKQRLEEAEEVQE